MTVLSVGHDASARPPYYVRVQAGDLDGDGIADQADLKLVCTDGFLEQSLYTIVSPRDLATGQSSGRRMHQAITVAMEWAAANPQLNVIQPTYDVKKMEGARVGRAKWANISLRNADGLCGLYGGCSGGDRQIEVQHYQQLTAISECLRRAFNL